jgi:hypothetical protein
MTQSFSSELLAVATEWKCQFDSIEPVIQELVQCYDYSAHLARMNQSDVAPRLLNELWDELDPDFPSELDVRAAAVRLYSFDSRIPNWLESKISNDAQAIAAGRATVGVTDVGAMAATGMQATTEVEAPAIADSLKALHRRVADEIEHLCVLTGKLEEMLSEESKEPVPAALDASLDSLANIKADDIRAAAVRLGIATESHLAW